MFSSEKAKPALMGTIGGAVALAVVGFSWGGWVTSGTAEAMADKRSKTAVVAALAPICVAQFQQESSFEIKLSELNETSPYRRAAFIEEGGWATMPGSEESNRDVARACAEMIGDLAES